MNEQNLPVKSSVPDLSTGITALDEILQMLIPGDNLVWQINSVDDYRPFVRAFAEKAVSQGKRLIYFRFAEHESLLPDSRDYKVHHIDPTMGFETFTIEIRRVIQREKNNAWYVFDCLSDLPVHWYSDLMLGNFFVLICPYILQMKSLAYFALMLNRHSISVAAQIRKTTQILLNIFKYQGDLYIQPLKVDQRRSPTMYLPHRIKNGQLIPVTDSATIAKVASILANSDIGNSSRVLDVWERTFLSAQRMVDEMKHSDLPGEIYQLIFKKLLKMVFFQDEKIQLMAEQFLHLEDLLGIKKRLIGTGRIGGKSIGMVLSRAVLFKKDARWQNLLEIHDSFYIGSDVYYTFIVQNGCWDDRQKQRDEATFLSDIDETREKILNGTFPEFIIEQFVEMLDYFGQSPIIVRSSSLLEDNFGNAFSGKYESIFCVNQGTREERLEAFLKAVRQVFASTMSKEALMYRSQRHLLNSDEQMALLVQRVSGEVHGSMFAPHVAGVGYSFNPYAWSSKIDPAAGVLRLVCGLGTRAVERHDDDYTRIVALNTPGLLPEKSLNAISRYSQSHVDILDLQEN
ncbi:PEP/pyruvate-binding domain-containing protein, partial [Candidatus Latescibacterota bacterium]